MAKCYFDKVPWTGFGPGRIPWGWGDWWWPRWGRRWGGYGGILTRGPAQVKEIYWDFQFTVRVKVPPKIQIQKLKTQIQEEAGAILLSCDFKCPWEAVTKPARTSAGWNARLNKDVLVHGYWYWQLSTEYWLLKIPPKNKYFIEYLPQMLCSPWSQSADGQPRPSL